MFLLMMADTLRKGFFINAFLIKPLTKKKTRRENNFFPSKRKKNLKAYFPSYQLLRAQTFL